MHHERWLRFTHAPCLSCETLIPRAHLKHLECRACVEKEESSELYTFFGYPSFVLYIKHSDFQTWDDFLYFPGVELKKEVTKALRSGVGIQVASRIRNMSATITDRKDHIDLDFFEIELDSWEVIQLNKHFAESLTKLQASIRSGKGSANQREHLLNVDLGL